MSRDITSVASFQDYDVPYLLREAETHKIGDRTYTRLPLQGKRVIGLFYEPSTRTRVSFEVATQRLGGNFTLITDAAKVSSDAKGESLEDTIYVLSGMCDVIVLRHPKEGAAARAAKVSRAVTINAGDGGNEHPTQTFVDFFTLWEVGKTRALPKDGIRFLFYGDNDFSRTVAPLCRMLLAHGPSCRLPRIKSVAFGGPRPRNEIVPRLIQAFEARGITAEYSGTGIRTDVDVVYLTRAQRERYQNGSMVETSHDLQIFGVKEGRELPEHAIIMHPLPRVGELSPDVDTNPRAHYFTQADNGIPARMALLEAVLRP